MTVVIIIGWDHIIVKNEKPFLLLPEITLSTEVADPFPTTGLRSSSLNLRILISSGRNFLSELAEDSFFFLKFSHNTAFFLSLFFTSVG